LNTGDEPTISEQIAEVVVTREIQRAVAEIDTEDAVRQWAADEEIEIPEENLKEIVNLIDKSRVHVRVGWE
jgi:hypothetical protein